MLDVCTELGEGVFLDNTNGVLFWLDINSSILFSRQGDRVYKYKVLENASTVLFAENDLVYLATRSGIISYSLISKDICQISRTPRQYALEIYRSNDGVKLGDKLYMYGVMRDKPIKNDGALIVSKDGMSKIVCTDISIPNTFIKIPNTYSLLIADSFDGVVYKMTFNKTWSSIVSKVKWFDLSHTNTTPDGGCISSDGRIFISIWDGFKVVELDLNGKLIQEFKVPVPRPTNCALDVLERQLFVTSAYEGLTEHDRQRYPLSGSIITLDINAC